MYFSVPGLPLYEGLRVVDNDDAANVMCEYMVRHGSIDWYLEHEVEVPVEPSLLLEGPVVEPSITNDYSEEVRVDQGDTVEPTVDKVFDVNVEEVLVDPTDDEVDVEVEVMDDIDHPYFSPETQPPIDDDDTIDEEVAAARANFEEVLAEAMGAAEGFYLI
ncbi:hypothetical protein CCACVL1_06191 [Corchorus capsularis]|uniref:Uncharacterized protein n=1 Tax=Corchorus capsularis TaxID=210143 RepID=A0A1R3JGV3_COCAP|nr:hypothetical protein CCACVL1_06191 [Corchorus capsularis]